jgi:ubiquinone/menaquinone biosynthesis C-methylase UbiE
MSSRKERVMAQYGNSQAAADYWRANEGARPEARFFRSRLQLVNNILASYPGGDLLDAGCGPGIMVRALLDSRPHDFRITVLDQSRAMVEYCVKRARDIGDIYPTVGQLEAMPFADVTFDVILVMGALEYTDARLAIHEISRVTRPGGLVIVTMLNPLSPYRLTEWFLFWPLLRLVGTIEKIFRVPAERRHGARFSGIHAYPVSILRRLMRQTGLQPVHTFYFDVTPVIPPFDRLPKMIRRTERAPHERTVTCGWRRWMGTAYLIAAKRSGNALPLIIRASCTVRYNAITQDNGGSATGPPASGWPSGLLSVGLFA